MSKKVDIIMYHYVRNLQVSEYPAIKGLDVSIFRKQIEYLMDKYKVVRMEDVIKACQAGDEIDLPENAVLLTFDDGYIDHYQEVYPILREYGIQGSFFPNAMAVKEHKLLTVNRIHFILAAVETDKSVSFEQLVQECFACMNDYREQGVELKTNEAYYKELAIPNRWDSGEVIFIKRLLQNALPEEIRTEIAQKLFVKYVGESEKEFARNLYMNKNQICELKQNGMFVGLHGYDHYWLAKLPLDKMHEDIVKALDYFEDVIDRTCYVMNYPYGNYNEDVLECVRQTGGILGLSVVPEQANLAEHNNLALPRWDANDVYPKGDKV